MKKPRTLNIPRSLHEAFVGLQLNRSAAVRKAVLNAEADTELLVKALRYRMDRPLEENDVRTSVYEDQIVGEKLKSLSYMTKLSVEQVLRLAMEAYIHKL